MSDEIKVKLILEAQKALQDAKALGESFAKLTDDADAAATAAKKYADLVKKEAAEATKYWADAEKELGDAVKQGVTKNLKDAEQAATDLKNAQSRANEVFAKGIGGGELAEKLRDVSTGLRNAHAAGLSATQSLMSYAGALGSAARAALAAGRQVVAMGDAVSDLSRRAHGGAVTQASNQWEAFKLQLERTGLAAVRVGEAIGGAAVKVGQIWQKLSYLNPILRVVVVAFEDLWMVVSNLDRVFDTVAGAINAVTGVTQEVKPALEHAGQATGELGDKTERAVRATELLKDATHGAGEKFDVAQQAARGLADTLRSVKDAMNELSFATRRGEQETDSFTRAYRASLDAVVGAANERRNRRSVTRQLLAERRANHGQLNGVAVSDADIRGVTGVAAGPDLRELRAQLAAARIEEQGLVGGQAADALVRRAGETTEHYLQRELAMRRQNVEVIRAQRAEQESLGQQLIDQDEARQHASVAYRDQLRAGARGASATMAQGAREGDALAEQVSNRFSDNSLGGQVRSQFGIVRDEQTHLLRSSQTFAQQFSATVGGAFNTVTQAASNHFAALIEGRETAGEALRGFVHDSLMALAQDAFVKALYNTGQGFAFLASYQYPQAASAFTAAGIFAGIAALAGLGGALTTAPTQGATPAQASGGGPARSARAGGGADAAGGRGDTIINVTYSGTIYSREHAANEVVGLINDAVERGVRPRMG